MDLGVLEGQTKGGYFSDYIFDPSVNQCNVQVPEDSSLHTGLTPTRKSHRDSCWQFGCQALTSLDWLRNHVKVMGERKNSQLILQVYLNLNIIRWLRRYEMKMKRKNNS